MSAPAEGQDLCMPRRRTAAAQGPPGPERRNEGVALYLGSSPSLPVPLAHAQMICPTAGSREAKSKWGRTRNAWKQYAQAEALTTTLNPGLQTLQLLAQPILLC